MPAAVLLSDSESETRDYLERQLKTDGFEVLSARFGGEALDLAERRLPDLVLLSEVDLCARLREGEPGRSWNRAVPVIVLGHERADAVDRLRAFQHGADDYVHRPIVYEELVARIRAVLRRVAPPPGDRLEVGDLLVDRATRRVTVRDETVQLAGKEFALLCKLASDPTRVFTKDELLRDVWGFRTHCRTRTLDSHVSRLRSKLACGSDDRFVVNVWGVGYRLID
jgi:DNA-binding response OmpR family regulator